MQILLRFCSVKRNMTR